MSKQEGLSRKDSECLTQSIEDVNTGTYTRCHSCFTKFGNVEKFRRTVVFSLKGVSTATEELGCLVGMMDVVTGSSVFSLYGIKL